MQRGYSLLLKLLAAFDAKLIPYCLLGDSRGLPTIVSDVDLVVAPKELHRLPLLLDEFCRDEALRLVQGLQHERDAYFFVLAHESPRHTEDFLSLEIRGDYCHAGRVLLTADEFLARSHRVSDAGGHIDALNTCAPAYEFCYRLLKKIEQENLPPHHSEYVDQCLTRLWQRDPHGSLALLHRFWDEDNVLRVARAAESGRWHAIAADLPGLRAELHRGTRVGLRDSFVELSRRWRLWRHPPGMVVGVLGASGVGKSSVIAAIDRRVRRIFQETWIVHLRPGFLYPPERTSSRAPLAETTAHGRIRSLFGLLAFAADYCFGYWAQVRLLTFRSGAVWFDRYYDDLLADPQRYRQGGWPRLARLLSKIVPRPDTWLLLDASAEVLQTRKRDVPFAEAERQRLAYHELLREQVSTITIDASRSFEEVVHSAAAAVLAVCEARTRLRLNLPTREAPISSKRDDGVVSVRTASSSAVRGATQ
jgi:thymidylate kinase